MDIDKIFRDPFSDEKIVVESSEAFFDTLLNAIDRCVTGAKHILILQLSEVAAKNGQPARPDRYLQVLSDESGALQIEAMSNYHLDPAQDHLTVADERALARLGWRSPGPHSPNWHRVFPDPWPWPSPVAAELVGRTLLDVFRAQGLILSVDYITAQINNQIRRCTNECSEPAAGAQKTRVQIMLGTKGRYSWSWRRVADPRCDNLPLADDLLALNPRGETDNDQIDGSP
jgi:hypothetical protein